jgi:hypothetical protein
MSYGLPISYPSALMVLTPNAQWSIQDENDYSSLVWLSTDVEKPTQAALDAEVTRQVAAVPYDLCKEQAKKLIAASDWAMLSDVGISNVSEFEAYRAQLRALIKTPVVSPTFPTEPQPVWI